MTFVSLPFLMLFAVTALLVWRIKPRRARHIILLISSYIFYAYWDVRFLALLVGQTFISFILARCMAGTASVARRRTFCGIGVAISLGILGFFKYFNFFVGSVQRAFGLRESDIISIILPIGISFYTFQAISYLVDVYRGQVEARRDFVTVSLYISFFPQLVAGPIVRAADFLPQLDEDHEITADNAWAGAQIFLNGLFKKVVVADRLAVCVDAVYRAPAAYDSPSVICAVIAYAMQIYCDFSGYTDMAVGVAKFFGYDLCPNFDLPYLSKNPTEFWRRWHISLSTWLKDYLYIPLGGNRKGRVRTYINLMLTMLLGGLWHGANWTFVIWGGLHGAALVLHKLLFGRRKRGLDAASSNSALRGICDAACILLNFIFVSVCWIFFRAQTLGDALTVFCRIFTGTEGIHYIYVYTIIFAVLLLAGHIVKYIRGGGHDRYLILPRGRWSSRFAICLEAWLILLFAYGGETAFVYFQF